MGHVKSGARPGQTLPYSTRVATRRDRIGFCTVTGLLIGEFWKGVDPGGTDTATSEPENRGFRLAERNPTGPPGR